jgi:hypothetical protein
MESKVRAINRVTRVMGDLQANQAGEALLAPGSAEYEEITRGGFAFHFITPTTTAAVIAVPTVACAGSLYNTADDGGRSLIIDAVFGYSVAGGAVLYQASMIYVLGQTRVAALAGGIVIRKNNGLGVTSDSIALATDAGNLDAVTGVAVGWAPIGNSIVSAVASLGQLALFVPVDGRIIVPPGRALGLHVLASAVGTTWQVGVMWHEKQITLS